MGIAPATFETTPVAPPAKSWRPLWFLGALALAGLVMLPVAAVTWVALNPVENIWPHLISTVLPRQIRNTAFLLLGNMIGVVLLGVGTAWLVTMCRFPGRGVLEWALLLPLAMPAYITAFIYTDLLEFAGPVQRSLRLVFGWQTPADYWFPEIRSLGGAIFVMSFVLYPYVYLLARATFLEQSVCVLEASRVLGRRGSRVAPYELGLRLFRSMRRIGLCRLLTRSGSSNHLRATSAYPPTGDILDKAGNVSSCRVGPGNFTPSPSQIRT